ncbi:MAG: efflux RND transporter permease subunit [Hydrogenibacillus schlegelii]|uniref:Efflux RND transporter permease subunit n=2 Tax=Hydrogenibacillus schlegelii TaxID=1484 RepID=A0A947CZN0_HYDSH|nr:efflux RND transporter permease subunit [Hydrogenibacillus schlegelii]
MNVVDFSVRRPVFITMVIVGMLLVGLFFLPKLPVDLFPKLDLPIAVVVTSYPGASPEEIENRITRPIENAVGTVSRVSKVESQSQTGSSLVLVHFEWGTNMDKAALDLARQVDRVSGFLPDDAGRPLVLTIDPTEQPILLIGLSGDRPLAELQSLAEDVVEPALRKLDGVASVGIAGGEKTEIRVELDPHRLAVYGLSPAAVAQAIGQAGFLATAGGVESGDRKLAVRFDAELKDEADVRAIRVPLPGGGAVAVGDLGAVRRAPAEATQLATLNGKPFLQLSVLKSSGGNTVRVSAAVHRELERLHEKLPPGTELTVIYDAATFINRSIQNVVEHGLLGGLIAMAVLYAFLGSVRTTFIVGTMLPVSVIATFTLMAVTDQSINLLTLGGLLIGMGSLVDFAIVVIESIHRHRLRGAASEEAASVGAKEVAAAVTASALAQTSVFVPMLFAAGLAKELFGPMALAVIFSHVAAWFGAVTFVPMLAARFLPPAPAGEAGPAGSDGRRGFLTALRHPVRTFQGAIASLERGYRRLLGWALRHRLVVIGLSFALFIAALALVPLIGSEFIPRADEGMATVSVELPPATTLEATAAAVRTIETILLRQPEVDTVASLIGAGSQSQITGVTQTNTATLFVNMKPRSERTRTTQQVMNAVLKEARRLPGVTVSADTQMTMAGSTGVQVNLSGRDPRLLGEVADRLQERLDALPGVASVTSSVQASRPEAAVVIDRARAAQAGVLPQEILTAVQVAFGGKKVAVARDGKDETDIRLTFPDGWATKDLERLRTFTFRAASGAVVALGDVARVDVEGAPTAITRSDGQRQARLTITPSGERPLGELLQDVRRTLAEAHFPDGVTWSLGGEAEQLAESFASLTQAMLLAILLIYMIMAAQFESFFQPFVIMFSLPPTFVGAFVGLWTHREPLSVTAFIGLIMVIGLVMNNAIVLVDYANRLRRSGRTMEAALLEAGPVRLRPILMTMLATNLVLVPFAYFGGESSESLRPLALVVIYGLLFSTLVTLVLIPAVLSLTHDLFARFGRRFRRQTAGPSHNLPPLDA